MGVSLTAEDVAAYVRCWNLPTLKLRFGGRTSLKLKDRSSFMYTCIFSFFSPRCSTRRFLHDSGFLLFKGTLLSSNGVIIFLLNHYSFLTVSVLATFSSVKNYSRLFFKVKFHLSVRSSFFFSPLKNLFLFFLFSSLSFFQGF